MDEVRTGLPTGEELTQPVNVIEVDFRAAPSQRTAEEVAQTLWAEDAKRSRVRAARRPSERQ